MVWFHTHLPIDIFSFSNSPLKIAWFNFTEANNSSMPCINYIRLNYLPAAAVYIALSWSSSVIILQHWLIVLLTTRRKLLYCLSLANTSHITSLLLNKRFGNTSILDHLLCSNYAIMPSLTSCSLICVSQTIIDLMISNSVGRNISIVYSIWFN